MFVFAVFPSIAIRETTVLPYKNLHGIVDLFLVCNSCLPAATRLKRVVIGNLFVGERMPGFFILLDCESLHKNLIIPPVKVEVRAGLCSDFHPVFVNETEGMLQPGMQ